MKKYVFYCLLCLFSFCSCGESLFDTYKDYAGDGEIRYVGKVTNLIAEPGWQRIRLSWENSADPIVDQIKVKWTEDNVEDSVYLPANTTSYEIDNLVQGSNFEVTVVSVDKDLNESLPTTTTVRPYNSDHEMVRSFTRVVSRNFFLHDHLLLAFMGWDSNISKAYVTYTSKSTGESKQLDLSKETVNSLHIDIPDVDSSKPVLVYREGYIEGCEDLITFSPITLDVQPLFSSEFKQEMKRQFGFDEIIPESWITSTTSLDLDWKIIILPPNWTPAFC
jgi:hypothetical protein